MSEDKKSADYYNGYYAARRTIVNLSETNEFGWLVETFGEFPSTEKRAAQLALAMVLEKFQYSADASIALYENAKPNGILS